MAQVTIIPTQQEETSQMWERNRKLEETLAALAAKMSAITGESCTVKHRADYRKYIDDFHWDDIVAIGKPVLVKKWWGTRKIQPKRVLFTVDSAFAWYPGTFDCICCTVGDPAVLDVAIETIRAYADEIGVESVVVDRTY